MTCLALVKNHILKFGLCFFYINLYPWLFNYHNILTYKFNPFNKFYFILLHYYIKIIYIYIYFIYLIL